VVINKASDWNTGVTSNENATALAVKKRKTVRKVSLLAKIILLSALNDIPGLAVSRLSASAK
jgi:hypothetical protein